jgi:hypothetical protein
MRRKLATLSLIMFVMGAVAYVLPGAMMRVFAQQFSGNTTIGGRIPLPTGINATIALSRIFYHETGTTDVWHPDSSSLVFANFTNFGNSATATLDYDSGNGVFRSPNYYAIDIGGRSNSITIKSTGAFARANNDTTPGLGDFVSITPVLQANSTMATSVTFTSQGLGANNHTALFNLGTPSGITFTGATNLIVPAGYGLPNVGKRGWLRLYVGLYGGAPSDGTDPNYCDSCNPITYGVNNVSENGNITVTFM